MSGTYPPLEKITPDNHGPYVIMADYIPMFLTVLVVLTRLASRYRLAKTVTPDDFFISTASVLLIAQSICVQVASDIGLGRHRDKITWEEFEKYSKLNYASQILAIGILACAKVSVCLLIESIKPQRYVLLANRGLVAIVGLWAVASTIALVLQCDQPHRWDFTTGRCVDQATLYYIVGTLNILTDVATVVLATLMMSAVQVSWQKRWLVISLFAVRLLVVAAAIVQLAQLPAYFHSTDQTWENVNPSIWTQIMLNLSLMTACIPSLKRLISDLQTGLTRVAIPEQFELASVLGSGSGTGSRGFMKSGQGTGNHSRAYHWDGGKSTKGSLRGKEGGLKFAGAGGGKNVSPEEGRSESVKGLTEDSIFQTVDYRVEYGSAKGY